MSDVNKVITRVLFRSDTTENWASKDPVLALGEIGVEYEDIYIDSEGNEVGVYYLDPEGNPQFLHKVGNGRDTWSNLLYSSASPKHTVDTIIPPLSDVPASTKAVYDFQEIKETDEPLDSLIETGVFIVTDSILETDAEMYKVQVFKNDNFILQECRSVEGSGFFTRFKKEGEDWTEFRSLSLRENVKVTVGAGGDFPTINAAVLYLSRFTPDLGVTAEVELQSGFVMMEQLLVDGLNLGWITITGVDAETVINEPSLTRIFAGVNNKKPAFGVINGTLPTIGQLFSFSSKGDPDDLKVGVLALTGKATIRGGCGVKNTGHDSISAVLASTINATGAIATGAGNHGIHADQGSTINATGAIVSSSGNSGIHVANGSTISALSATGTLSQAKNTVTAAGIIFQP